MSLCDKCVHRNVCGNEDAREEAVKVCDDFIDKAILSVPERENGIKYYKADDVRQTWCLIGFFIGSFFTRILLYFMS